MKTFYAMVLMVSLAAAGVAPLAGESDETDKGKTEEQSAVPDSAAISSLLNNLDKITYSNGQVLVDGKPLNIGSIGGLSDIKITESANGQTLANGQPLSYYVNILQANSSLLAAFVNNSTRDAYNALMALISSKKQNDNSAAQPK